MPKWSSYCFSLSIRPRKARADTSASTDDGFTALKWATRLNRTECIDLLRARGAWLGIRFSAQEHLEDGGALRLLVRRRERHLKGSTSNDV